MKVKGSGMSPPGAPSGMPGPGMGPPPGPAAKGGGSAANVKNTRSVPDGQQAGLNGTFVELPKSYKPGGQKSTHKITVPMGNSSQDIELKD